MCNGFCLGTQTWLSHVPRLMFPDYRFDLIRQFGKCKSEVSLTKVHAVLLHMCALADALNSVCMTFNLHCDQYGALIFGLPTGTNSYPDLILDHKLGLILTEYEPNQGQRSYYFCT